MKLNAISLALASAVFITGCNDSSSSSSPATSTYSVTAIDGYLSGALVWLDTNRNYQLDDGEPNTISGAGGVANLDVTGVDNPSQYPVVVRAIPYDPNTQQGTVDEDQGPVVDAYVMSAPAGETAVTPLTTLVHNKLEQDPNLSKDDAVAEVATDLGIATDDVLGDFLAEDAAKAAYAAEKLVEQGALPEDTTELAAAAEPGSAEAEKFTIIVAAANEEIKTILDTVDDEQTAEEIEQELETAPEIPPVVDNDGDGVRAEDDWDDDNPEEWLDSDGDGFGNNEDQFDDDATEWHDADNDGLGDNEDDPYLNDSDNDSYNNDIDLFPTDPTEWADEDEDGLGDNEDDPYLNDTDNDSYNNDVDLFPNDPTEWADEDGDQLGDNEDDQYPNDTDNDGYNNDVDIFPNDPTEWADDDGDGLGDNEDDTSPNDSDNDGVSNDVDNCVDAPNADQADEDNDGVGDVCDTDTALTWDNTNWDEATWQ